MHNHALSHLFIFAVALIARGIAPGEPSNAYKVRLLVTAAGLYKILALENPIWTQTDLWSYLKGVNDAGIQYCWEIVKETSMNVVIYHPVRGVVSLKFATLSENETVNLEGAEIFLEIAGAVDQAWYKHRLGVMYEGGNVILDHLGFSDAEISTRDLWTEIQGKSRDRTIVQNLLANITRATVKYPKHVKKAPVPTEGSGDQSVKVGPVQEATLYVVSYATYEADVTHRVPMWSKASDSNKALLKYQGVLKFTKSPTNRNHIWRTLKKLLPSTDKLREIYIEIERKSNVVINDDNKNDTKDNVDISKATDLIYKTKCVVSVPVEPEEKKVKVIPVPPQKVPQGLTGEGKKQKKKAEEA